MRTPRLPRARRNGKATGQAVTTQGTIERPPRFGEPLLLAGESQREYEAMVAAMYSAVRPRDTIERMLVSDVIALQWELERWRRFKREILQERGYSELRKFLRENMAYALYQENFVRILAECLQQKLPEDEADEAEELALASARNERDADAKVGELLIGSYSRKPEMLHRAKDEKARELVAAYARGEPEPVALITRLLKEQGLTINSVLASGCADYLDGIDRLDQLSAIAESRRNAALREVDRRRAALGADVRRALVTAEDGEFEDVVESAPAPKVAKAR